MHKNLLLFFAIPLDIVAGSGRKSSDIPAEKEAAVFEAPIDLMSFYTFCPEVRSSAVALCGQDSPTALVRSRFLNPGRERVEYVQDRLCHVATAIGNIKAYTLAAPTGPA